MQFPGFNVLDFGLDKASSQLSADKLFEYTMLGLTKLGDAFDMQSDFKNIQQIAKTFYQGLDTSQASIGKVNQINSMWASGVENPRQARTSVVDTPAVNYYNPSIPGLRNARQSHAFGNPIININPLGLFTGDASYLNFTLGGQGGYIYRGKNWNVGFIGGGTVQSKLGNAFNQNIPITRTNWAQYVMIKLYLGLRAVGK
jgi:hypothetical protein